MDQLKIIDREQEIVFTNFSEEEFEGRWNKKIWRLKAGRSYYLPFYLAEHFAKHLVNRELNKRATKEIADLRKAEPRIDSKEVDRREQSIIGNLNLRQELMDKCVTITNPTSTDVVVPREAPVREAPPLRTQERSANMVAAGKVAPGDLGPYNQPKPAPKSDEASFEGLDSKPA